MDLSGAFGPVLVTGATGFLGGHVARSLLARGVEVRVTGRNLANGLALAQLGADFRPVDLRDRVGMIRVCEGVRAVVHSGALSSAWGPYDEFYGINVTGTENVIEACTANGVQRLVHISSPSVMSRFEQQLNLTEADAFPETFVSVYSETKKLAEDRINAAEDIETVILRPKAIYGPGDNAIFPRLIEASAKGRLPLIGDGETVTDLTHVDDVVQACELALVKPEAAGKTYLIIGNPAIRIWDVITEVVTRLGHAAPSRKLPYKKAMRVATVMEAVWRTLHLPGEPLLTKYKVGILACSQTYDISAARNELGYEPKVALETGIQSVLDSLQGAKKTTVSARENKSQVSVGLNLLKSGDTITLEKFFMPHGKWRKMKVPATWAIIDHPNEGPIVFDTGYSRRFSDGTKRFPFKLASIVTPASISADDEAVAQVRARGIDPGEVRWLVLSHFDPDHYGGLRDFPNARIVCSAEAWESVRGKKGWAAFRVRMIPGHLPDDIAGRLYILPDFDGPEIGPFARSYDFFGDGAIRFVETPGHAAGQVAAFVRTHDGEVLLAADAAWNMASIEIPRYGGGIHRRIAVDKRGHDATYAKLRALRSARPELRIIPTHCPDTWNELGQDRKGAKADEPAA